MKFFKIAIIFTSVAVFYYASAIESDNFELENPINIISGGQSSSSSFQYLSNTSQDSQGQITSNNFIHNVGFMYFPTATSPVVSATPGDGEVVLTWTAANGTFANITSYSVGISTVSGGPYTYTSVGNVLTSTRTGLTNGTAYFFTIRSFAAGLLLSESAQVSATPEELGAGAGGGSGGGSSYSGDTGVIFSGRAYPLSKVNILKDGQLVLTTIAGPDAKFEAFVGGLSAGNYTFSILGEDKEDNESTLFSFPVFITGGVITSISGLFIAPTISVDKSMVKSGENIAIFGQASPLSEILIAVNSNEQFTEKTETDKNGVYLFNFDTTPLEFGQHSAKSKAFLNGEITNFSKAAVFSVGDETIFRQAKSSIPKKGDLNMDKKVNLIDFSIAAFWYKRQLSSGFIEKEAMYLSGDGQVDLVDFSIMAFYWTG